MTKIFVLHVKEGYQQRATHIEQMMARQGLPFEYILDGDIPDLHAQRLDDYFASYMHSASAATSCAMKHLLAYEQIVEQKLEGALILEDDIMLKSNFIPVFERSLREVTPEAMYVGYEATHLRFVKGSERRKGQVNYIKPRVQCTGAYYITRQGAEAILEEVRKNRCDLAFDLYLDKLSAQGTLKIYWSHPVIAEQGSHNGSTSSSITNKSGRLMMVKLKRRFMTYFKQMVYFFK